MKWLLFTLALAGCGGQPRVIQYAPPMPRPGDRPPPVVRLDDVSPEFRRDPMSMVDHRNDPVLQDAAKNKDPHLLIAEANREANTEPEEGEADGNTQTYIYSLTGRFNVYGCYKEQVEIMFAAGEKVVESMNDGKSEERHARLVKGWDHGFTESGDTHGHIVQVMVLRPIAEDQGIRKLTVHTSVGPYTFLLETLARDEPRCMDRVRFRHPKRELDQLIADDVQRKDIATKAAASGCASANYEIEPLEGSPSWIPTLVWRTCDGDHARVHIQFRADVAWSKIPALKVDGGVAEYRYVPEDHVMIYEGLFSVAVLKLGSKEQGYERVVIRALKEPR